MEIDDFCESYISRRIYKDKIKYYRPEIFEISINSINPKISTYKVLCYNGKFILGKKFISIYNYRHVAYLDSVGELYKSIDIKNRDDLIKFHNFYCSVIRKEIESRVGELERVVTYEIKTK